MVSSHLARPKSLTSGSPLRVEEDVSGFEIAMENAFAVGVLDGARDLGDERHALPRVVPQRGADFLQASAGREFHAEEREAVFALAHFVDRQNVGMIEARGGLRFAAEAGERFAGVGVITQDPFHGDDAAGMALAGAVDHAHAAPPDFLEDFVVSEAPVLVGQRNFGQRADEHFRRALVVRIKSGLEQTTDAKSARRCCDEESQ